MESYFLGANTKDGFCSLYGDFPPRGAYLHILKGGPGTGKSSLMGAIAKEAKARGYMVEQVLCSGDPDSLDGIYIPALKLAWADGTAPHVLEPKLLGVTGDYVNLTEYLIRPFTEEEKRLLLRLQAENKACYARAYQILSLRSEEAGKQTPARQSANISVQPEHIPENAEKKKLRRVFLSAISCKGMVDLSDQLRNCEVQHVSPEAIQETVTELETNGMIGFLCLSPLDPKVPEALVLPDQKIILKTSCIRNEETQHKIQSAVSYLAEAKRIHDRIEQIYRPHMEFRALSEYREKLIRELFS